MESWVIGWLYIMKANGCNMKSWALWNTKRSICYDGYL